MKVNLPTYAIIQVCIGVFLILGGIIRFINTENYWSGAETLFLGLGILIPGLAGNAKDNWEKKKLYFYSGFFLLTIGVVLIFYNTFVR